MASKRGSLLAYALGLPGAFLDHPWGEDVTKVGAKVFAFFGVEGHASGHLMTVKLSDSHGQALLVPGIEPAGYGLGKSGWVTVPSSVTLPIGVLRDWVEESYRLVAPKKLLAELDA